MFYREPTSHFIYSTLFGEAFFNHLRITEIKLYLTACFAPHKRLVVLQYRKHFR